MKLRKAMLASGVMDRNWTVRRDDWLRVEDDRVVDVNPGRSGNARFWGAEYLAYGTSPYVYTDSFHGSHADLLEAYVRSYGDGYRPKFWIYNDLA